MRMLTLFREITQALRQARRTLFVTAAAVATLALGIGATTLLYGLLYGVVQRPLPYSDPDALVQISSTRGQNGVPGGFSLDEFRDWQHESRSYSHLALFSSDRLSGVLPGDTARPLQGAVVSSGFFGLLGNPVRLGRAIGRDDDGSPSVVISERLWRTRLNADPGILDRTLLIKGEPFTIVGVANHTLTLPEESTDLWLPVEFRRLSAPPAWGMRGFRAFSVIARLQPGVSLATARDEAGQIAAAWQRRHPRFSADLSATVTGLRERLYGETGPGLRLLFACVACVMLIATLNVAGLLIARDAARQYETAVRLALGATTARLWRQSVIESAVMAAGGALSGVGLAVVAMQALRARPPAGLSRVQELAVDGPVLAVAAGISVGVTLLLGTVLGRRAARTPAAGVLQYGRGAGRGPHRLHQVLVVSQVVLSFVLVVASLLLTSGLRQLLDAGSALPDGRVLTLTIAGARRPILDRVLPELKALPGVEAAGVTSSLPPHLSQMQTTIAPPPGSGSPDPVPVDIVAVSPGMLDALGLTLLDGRFFAEADLSGDTRSFVISARAAARLFPGASAVGRSLLLGPPAPGTPPPVVVGVVDDVRYRGLGAIPEGAIYMPYTQRTFDVMHLVVKSRAGGIRLAADVRRVVARADSYQAVADARSMNALIDEASSTPRLRLRIVGALTAFALLLVAVGLHGVLAQTVASRRQEFAVRAALGASPGDLRTHIVAYAMRLVGLGLALGVVPAYAVSRALPAALSGASAAGPGAYALAALLIVIIGLAATWWPAVRAANRAPAESLHAA